jgi:hypothetical protein
MFVCRYACADHHLGQAFRAQNRPLVWYILWTCLHQPMLNLMMLVRGSCVRSVSWIPREHFARTFQMQRWERSVFSKRQLCMGSLYETSNVSGIRVVYCHVEKSGGQKCSVGLLLTRRRHQIGHVLMYRDGSQVGWCTVQCAIVWTELFVGCMSWGQAVGKRTSNTACSVLRLYLKKLNDAEVRGH